MYYFRCLSHIVDGFILPAGMRVWVVCTHTRTHLPDGYMMLPIYVPAGRNIIPYPSPYRVKPVGYLGFGYPLTSLSLRKMASLGTPQMQHNGVTLITTSHDLVTHGAYDLLWAQMVWTHWVTRAQYIAAGLSFCHCTTFNPYSARNKNIWF
jgi:hypothetical protein